MRVFEIYLDSAWHDISSLYVPSSLTIQRSGINSDRKSSVTSCSFTLYFNELLYNAIISCEDEIPVRISDGEHNIIFDGQMDPVISTSWKTPEEADSFSIECVDFSVKLDEYITQSASYPSVVGSTAFWIYNPEDRSMSILYRILELAGLSDRLDKNAPAIKQQIKHIAWNSGNTTYRTVIDSLLSDYGWVMLIRGEKVTFAQSAFSEIGNVDEITSDDIIGQISKDKFYIVANGVSVSWPKTKIIENALLWRGNLPIGDTANPRPGEPIAQGDYWPEDSDIIETWMDYGTDYLDVDWLEGKTRLKNDEITLISSSDWVLSDSRDEEVVIDPINDSFDVVYEALRARLRYKNTANEPKRLYWSQINGKALIKTHKIKTVTPEGATNPEEWETSYIYDQTSAERLAQIRYMWLKKGCFTISFKSTGDFTVGGVYHLFQKGLYEGYIQITAVTETDDSPLRQYTAFSTESFRNVKTVSIGSSGSGTASPGQDGASYRYAYKRSFTQPATPVGTEPEGWSLDVFPLGDEPVWVSMAKISSTGKILVDWTTPERVSAIGANNQRFIFKRSYTQPATPVGQNPAGWTFDSIPEGSEPAWVSIGTFNETGALVIPWTVPIRFEGKPANTPRYIYKRSYNQPETPVGDNPAGWTFDSIPEGSEPAWISIGTFSETGALVIPWTVPIRFEGKPANTPRYIYKRSYNQPETPVGDNPAGWTPNRIPDGYQPVWMSVGQFSETGNLVGSWTVPVRVSVEKEGAYRGAVSVLPSDPQDGDYIIWTGATNTQMQQHHIYKYVAIDDEWIETTESDKVMGCQKDALQIAKDSGSVIYAALLFVDLLVANKLRVGGGDEYEGLLVQFMNDDGGGKPLIEIRSDGNRLFYLDIDTGKLYASFAEVVQYLPYTFNDSLDASHPAVFAFYVPDGKYENIRIRVVGQRYRTYNSTTTTKDGLGGTFSGNGFGSGHGSVPSGGGGFTATVNVTVNGTIRVTNHNHDLSLGIIEDTYPNNMNLSFDNSGDGAFSSELSITSGQEITKNDFSPLENITPGGWKQIKITSSTRGRIQIQLILKMLIDTVY